jgi:TonB family protein
LKTKHSKYLCVSALAALLLTGLGAVFSPPYVPSPWERTEDIIITVLPPEPITVPPAPRALPLPKMRPDFVPSDSPGAHPTIPPDSIFSLSVASTYTRRPVFVPVPATEPVVVHSVVPGYSELARQAGAEGTVEVRVTIDKSGRVVQAVIRASDTVESLNQSALAAAREFLFTPCMQRDVAVECQVVLRFTFTLD